MREGSADREEDRRPLQDRRYRGVWLIDRPGAIEANPERERWLVVDIPSRIVRNYEFAEGVSVDKPALAAPKRYREFMIPAAVVNQYGVRLATDEELSG